MFTDAPTIMAFSLLLVAFLGCLQLWLWLCDRGMVALGIWGGAHLLGAVGLVMLSGRGMFPNRVSIDLANAVILATYGLIWVGARRFEQRRISLAASMAGAVIWLLACRIPGFYLSLVNRTVGVSLLVAIYELLSMREFLRHRPGGSLPSRHALAVLFGADALNLAIRTVITLRMGLGEAVSNLPATAAFALPIMMNTTLAIGTGVLLIAVAKEEAEQRSVTTIALARDEADRANTAKSRFLSRVSHELRTPLNGVLGMAQVLARDPTLRGQHRERAEVLEQAGRHLLAIVNDILDLARAESGKFALAPHAARLDEIIRGGMDLMVGAAADKRIALELDAAPDLPVAVEADPLRVRQILLNLLGNAIKFTPPDGRVTVAVARLGPSGGVRLSVTDTGPGVSDLVRPHLFKDFATHAADLPASEGSGLGLAISATLAQAMGGRLRYEPGPGGVGSRFVAELPLPTATAPPRAVAPEREARPHLPPGLRVLVVDDVPVNRMLAEALLRQEGAVVTQAADGDAALRVLAGGAAGDARYDVVLMDVYMPGVDGLTATQRIRALPGAARNVPIIALTADADPDRLQTYHAVGMDACITKPLDADTLMAAIVRVCDARSGAGRGAGRGAGQDASA
jgi:signal transduction histidine kinase/CheY-like chemotaxis protein